MTTLIHTDSAKSGKPVNDQILDLRNISKRSYKKIPNQKHYCSFKCGWCDLLGRSIVEQKYKDFGNILLEDDSQLCYNFLGRELVK